MIDARLSRLIEATRSLADGPEPSAFFERLLDSAIELTGAERGFLVLRHGEWIAARDRSSRAAVRTREKVSQAVLNRLFGDRRPFVLRDADLPVSESLQERSVRAVCAVPVGSDGAFVLETRTRSDAFRSADLDLVAAFASLASAFLDRRPAPPSPGFRLRMIGESPRMLDVRRHIERAAAVPYPVLLQGESGTGKELAAREIHERSPRSAGPFVAVSCAALPDPLLAAELFGHDAGAFTGADRARTGLFEQARGGTLFLDEMETMSPAMQECLLRVLQEKEIRRVGSAQTIRIDVRIVSASNEDLGTLADRSRFRRDLLYRLDVLSLRLPPLRERGEDLPALVEHLLRCTAGELGRPARGISPAAMDRLLEHPWPGNVRELQNSLRRAFVESDEDPIGVAAFSFFSAPRNNDGGCRIVNIDDYIRGVLRKHAGTMTMREIARQLGLSRKTLWEKRKHGGMG